MQSLETIVKTSNFSLNTIQKCYMVFRHRIDVMLLMLQKDHHGCSTDGKGKGQKQRDQLGDWDNPAEKW